MDLVGRVRRALEERSVHPEEFERCACALLQDVYPGLSAVEGGHDFGRDADIYLEFGYGPQSTVHQQMCDYFTSLGERVPALQPVARAGLAQQTARLQQTEAQERQERIYGR